MQLNGMRVVSATEADEHATDMESAPREKTLEDEPTDKSEGKAKEEDKTVDVEVLEVKGEDENVNNVNTANQSQMEEAVSKDKESPPPRETTVAPAEEIKTPTQSPFVAVVETEENVTPAPTTTTPALRTENTTSESATAKIRSHFGESNTPLLLAFAGICCFFLLLWGRKRKFRTAFGGNAVSSSDSGASSSSSSGKVSSKVQYSRIDNKREENVFDDDDDDFGNDVDKWDDWENDRTDESEENLHVATSTHNSVYAHPNPFAATSSKHTVPIPNTTSHGQLHEITISTHVPPKSSTSAGSNSSNESYEVVSEESLLPPPPTATAFSIPPPPQQHQPPNSSNTLANPFADEHEKESADDLFSQFGMVPTFKKGVQTPPASVNPFQHSITSSPLKKAPQSTAPVSGAAASTLFAAEMDDLSTAAASDEWGEDDEWVQGI